MENKWKSDIQYHINNKTSIASISLTLKNLKLLDVKQSQIRNYLSEIRLGSIDEIMEDRILEILDVVEGFCDKKYIVWLE